MAQQRELPDWEAFYREKEVETMPWFNPELDADLEQALTKLNLDAGTVLDLGTGPGTQALALAERGFQVIATDLSETAIEKAQNLAKEKGLDISWKQDDILNSNLQEKFEFVFDRGCFHILPPDRRQDYVHIVNNLIKPGGYLFLKCFSYLQSGEQGPYRFTSEQIQEIFSSKFNVRSIEETVYQGTLDPLPKALFCVMEKS
ncbi:MAG: hypothetical protein NVSMB70_10780 [Chamaesiphon sp.]